MSFRLAVVVSTVIFCGVLLAARVHAQVPVVVSAPDPTTESGSASAEDPAAPLASEPVADELPLAGGISPESEPSAHEAIVPATLSAQIGRAACRESVCKYVSNSVVAETLNKKYE